MKSCPQDALEKKEGDILRRFNVCATRGKGWLPQDYGTKPVHEMNPEEKEVMNNFEGEKLYTKNMSQRLFADKPNSLQLEM